MSLLYVIYCCLFPPCNLHLVEVTFLSPYHRQVVNKNWEADCSPQ
uniref:Uncharacterized protein n=1 Tax=Anguilla anguilla TaxID=7936 RepID=A0A0E9V0U0_ANGAN